MALPLWGELEKAQDDSRTIEEYIDDVIAEHNDDTESHLSSGQSLNSHKTESVIDHPARSVYDDKFAYDRNVIDLKFNSLDPYDVVHEVEISGIDSFLFSSSTSLLTAQIYGSVGDMATDSMFNYQNNPRMLTSFMVNATTSQTGYLFVGENDEGRGFGFKIVNNTLYGFYFDDTNSEHTTSLLTISAGVIYKCEAVVTYPDNIDFYVNNTLVESDDSADLPTSMDYILNIPWIEWTGTTSSTRYLFVRGFHWEADLPS